MRCFTHIVILLPMPLMQAHILKPRVYLIDSQNNPVPSKCTMGEFACGGTEYGSYDSSYKCVEPGIFSYQGSCSPGCCSFSPYNVTYCCC
ncbi:hypothetical protein M441DRAFT_431832 [Trichoderma asperellum CBS 433.97]|uniref:Uncharacterized protein n=1 Tax=Trichoderma asperellum (strain ATCC 204424 / CBS 433.97 / NBRC 101777) TaxID=1042311 RepID=A0A2T3Z6K1_TRIA4|nr:hypothetical protein M441DRAFT_431832 [Trichoderma asperellum CBS 433.97]PTB40425.1 hypothetical protein M441DRAFT_431832 [Trichoderma asperellum CBS 433.97]